MTIFFRGGRHLGRDTVVSDFMFYFMLRLSLFLIAVVLTFVTILVLPPVILICLTLELTLFGGVSGIVSDKSISQKRE
jgi:hypothetical protein